MSSKIQHLVERYQSRDRLSRQGVWKGELYTPQEIPFLHRGWCWRTLLLSDEDELIVSLEVVPDTEELESRRNSPVKPTTHGIRRLTPVMAESHPLTLEDPLKEQIPMDETLDIISLDLERLLIDDIFSKESVKNEMKRILYNYVIYNNTSYKQGYHELCGTIYLQMQGNGQDEVMVNTFNIFNKLMKHVQPVFYTEGKLIEWCRNTFGSILKHTSPKLHDLLVKHHRMDNTIWLIRWTRLLLLREFDMDYVLKIWDHLLTFQYPIEGLMACMIVVLLIVVSQELHCCEDQGDLISILLHYPREKAIDVVELLKYSGNLYELWASKQFEDMKGVGDTLCKIYSREWYEKCQGIDVNRLRLEERLRKRVEWKLSK